MAQTGPGIESRWDLVFGGDTSFPFAKSCLEVEPEYGNRGPQTPAGLNGTRTQYGNSGPQTPAGLNGTRTRVWEQRASDAGRAQT